MPVTLLRIDTNNSSPVNVGESGGGEKREDRGIKDNRRGRRHVCHVNCKMFFSIVPVVSQFHNNSLQNSNGDCWITTIYERRSEMTEKIRMHKEEGNRKKITSLTAMSVSCMWWSWECEFWMSTKSDQWGNSTHKSHSNNRWIGMKQPMKTGGKRVQQNVWVNNRDERGKGEGKAHRCKGRHIAWHPAKSKAFSLKGEDLSAFFLAHMSNRHSRPNNRANGCFLRHTWY